MMPPSWMMQVIEGWGQSKNDPMERVIHLHLCSDLIQLEGSHQYSSERSCPFIGLRSCFICQYFPEKHINKKPNLQTRACLCNVFIYFYSQANGKIHARFTFSSAEFVS